MTDEWISPIGPSVTESIEENLRDSQEYRYELDLTQKEVAEKAGTSHSFISKVEGGDHMPTIGVLKRILAVLDEELLIGIERVEGDGDAERVIAQVPRIGSELAV